ncbi:MAG: type II secretion system F family protein [Gemmataceae bacterium]|nr:type II secretion system F family protein [Gemmataceae bacterium]
MTEWMWIGLIFAGVGLVSFVALYWAGLRQQRVVERLRPAESESGVSSHPELVLGPMTPALASGAPMTAGDRAALEKELREAGFYRPTALMEYSAIRAVLVFLPILIALAVALLADRQRMSMILIGGLLVSALGFSIPRVYVSYLARKRAREIERGLPVALDLLALGLSGGQHILAAFARVSQELRHSYPVLAEEFQIVLRQAELRSLPHALQQFADRVGVGEVRNLAVILTQAERLGTDLSTALLEFSNTFRLALRTRADAQANRASFWMLFPTVLCLWIPAAIVLAGPVFFEFNERRRETARMLEEIREDIKKAGPVLPSSSTNGKSQGIGTPPVK